VVFDMYALGNEKLSIFAFCRRCKFTFRENLSYRRSLLVLFERLYKTSVLPTMLDCFAVCLGPTAMPVQCASECRRLMPLRPNF
jgi:hypothetical protein